MASTIPSTSSQLTLSNVSLATTVYFTSVPPDDPPTITEVPAHFSPEDCSTFNPPAVAAVDNAAPLLHPHHIPGVPGPLQLAPLQHQLHSWGRSAYSRLVISNLTKNKINQITLFSMASFSNNFFLERKSENIQDNDSTKM